MQPMTEDDKRLVLRISNRVQREMDAMPEAELPLQKKEAALIDFFTQLVHENPEAKPEAKKE